MDPISLALGLSQFVPVIAKWITGSDKSADVAGKVIDVAKAVTGTSDGQSALASIQADPNKVLEFQQAITAQQADIEKAYLADIQDARQRDVAVRQVNGGRNKRADIMLALTYIGMVALVSLMVVRDIDANTALGGVVLLLIGKLVGQWETGFNFEFGTNRDSKKKDDTIKNLSQS